MNNPWYDRVNGQGTVMQPQPQPAVPGIRNPAMLMGQIQQAMRSPMSYAMQAFPDVPNELWNNPSMALQHIMQTRGLTQGDIQNMIAGVMGQR